ncbi:C-type lectin domain family 4 member E [Lemmus lemmus]
MNWRRFQSSCYFFSTTTLTWRSSLKNCSEMGAHLVVINTPEEQVMANRLLCVAGMPCQSFSPHLCTRFEPQVSADGTG